MADKYVNDLFGSCHRLLQQCQDNWPDEESMTDKDFKKRWNRLSNVTSAIGDLWTEVVIKEKANES